MKLIKPTKIEDYQETKIDKIIERVFVISMFLMVLLALVLGLSTRSKAATARNTLPFIPSANTYSLDQSQVDILIDAINQYDSSFDTSQPYFIFTDQVGSWYDWGHFVQSPVYYVYFPEYLELDNAYFLPSSFPPGTNFDSYQINQGQTLQVTLNNCTSFGLVPRSVGDLYNGYSINKTVNSSGTVKGFFGSSNAVTVSNNYFDFTYYPDYPTFTSSSWATSDGSVTKIFLTGSKIIPGQVTDPDLVDTSDLPVSDPDINDYLPTTPEPTIDNTSLETLVESLFGWLKWQFQQIKGLFNFLIDKMGYFIGKIIQGINNAISTLVDNLKSLFKPLLDSINGFLDNIKTAVQTIKDQIDYIIEPINTSTINTAFQNTHIYGIYNSYSTFFTAFDQVFDISEPNDWTIVIHLSQLSYFDLPDYTLHLGDNIIPFRNALRSFLWVLVCFGSIILVEKNLPTWLMGSDSGGGGTKSD